MLKRNRSFLVLSLAVAAMAPMLLSAPSHAQAQNRHAYLEEFTGSWCGFCVRGSYAIETLKAKYPSQVAVVSIHNGDPMANAQGDSMTSCIGGPAGLAVPGFPDSWTARTVEPTSSPAGTWNVDPSAWADGIGPQFGLANGTLADDIVAQTAAVKCVIDNVSYNLSTNMVTARVTATFTSAMSGDFRLNLMVTEDSVTGSDPTTWDQHNYYSSTDAQVGGTLPSNPFYNDPNPIPNWEYMDVFREAVAGIWGQDGIIPASTTAGGSYSTTFTFPLPSSVLNPNHVHLVGLVHQFSATNATTNTVFDAMEAPLTTTTISSAPNELSISADDGQYLIAHANGDTSTSLTIVNNGASAVTAGLSLDPSSVPAGWTLTFNPASTSVAAGGQVTIAVKISAPEQSAYVVPTILIRPQQPGEYIPGSSIQLALVSDNTNYAAYNFGGESAAINGMPDTMRLHTAYIPLNANTLAYYDPSSSGLPIVLAMFPNDAVLDGSETVTGAPSIMNTISDAMAAGEKVYVSSNDAMAWAFVGNATTETDAVQGFFLDSLGITWKSDKSRINSSNQYVSFRIDGTTDPIGAGMTNLTANSTGSLSGDPETPLFNVPSGSPSTSLFYVDNTKASNVSLKAQLPSGNRVVYMGFALDALTDQVKADSIFRRSIEWLMSASPSASITANPASLDFGVVPAGQSKSMNVTLTNSGSTSVTVNTISVNPSSANFSFSGIVLPFTIGAGQTATLSVTFAPVSEGDQTATLEVSGAEGNSTPISLHGATAPSSVGDGTTPSESLAASPNPFHGMTQIQYVAGQDEHGVSLAAYDLLGREVAKLATQSNGGNVYTALFDGSKLANGTYVIIAHSTSGTHEVRVVNQQ